MGKIYMTKEENILLEHHISEVLQANNKQLLEYYAKVVQQEERNISVYQKDKEAIRILIDKLQNEILKRMNNTITT